ncbi:hypothetical protein [Vibrio sp. D431a]|uniref:hypothetical protein n=1 Tax=Vibrio sp. D431a TaxID=2837388 RepID=UPI00255466E9|nr:hypothetical protein [Vibrio sp. D431a]MDK9793707.1 hypothetical protein [Vibrio sp. D431a]
MVKQKIFEKVKAFFKEKYDYAIPFDCLDNDEIDSLYISDMGAPDAFSFVFEIAEHFGVDECVDGDEITDNATLTEVVCMLDAAIAQKTFTI